MPVCPSVHVCAFVYMRVSVCVCVCVRVRARSRVCVRVHLYIDVYKQLYKIVKNGERYFFILYFR